MVTSRKYVPSYYSDNSRDFQLFELLLDLVANDSKANIDRVDWFFKGHQLDEGISQSLAKTFNIKNSEVLTPSELRTLCKSYIYLVKNKGSEKAIQLAVDIYLDIQGYSRKNKFIDTRAVGEDKKRDYTIHITVPRGSSNIDLLYRLVELVAPAGFLIDILVKDVSTVKPKGDTLASVDKPNIYAAEYTIHSNHSANKISNNSISNKLKRR
jgi:hypothetical protein